MVTVDQAAMPFPMPVNQNREHVKGAELEWNTELSKTVKNEGNISWQTNNHSQGRIDERLVPEWQVKIGFSYERSPAFTASVYNIYFSAIDNDNAPELNPDSKDTNLLTINLKTQLNNWLNLNTNNKHTLSLLITNALESDPVYQPDEFFGPSINTFPWREERGFYLFYEGAW